MFLVVLNKLTNQNNSFMKKITILAFAIISIFSNSNAQTSPVTQYSKIIKSNHNFGLTNPLWSQGLIMTYDESQVNALGSAFTFNFVNPGGSGFKGYPSGGVGNFKANGTYHIGNVAACGLPVKIQDLDDNLRMKWKVSQQNANDADDKWWATINVIFDLSATSTSEPDPDARDYDLVIQLKNYTDEVFTDLTSSASPNYIYWYFARKPDNSLKTFDLYLNGVKYEFAVRYKFFNYPVGHANYHKNDKVHVKFIPVDNNAPLPNLDHSLKYFIDKSAEYKVYLPLTTSESTLFDEKVADPNLWIKTIQAGYEVYTGSFTISNDYFYTVLDSTPNAAPQNLTATKVGHEIQLNWNANNESDFNNYRIYRSINDGSFTLLADNVYDNNYLDTTSLDAKKYTYYVVAVDRSFNVSSPSNTASKTFTKGSNNRKNLNNVVRIYPNPTKDIINFVGLEDQNVTIEIYNILGTKVFETTKLSNSSIDISNFNDGIFILILTTKEGEVYTTKLIKK